MSAVGPAVDLLPAIRAAREQHRAGAGAVLDVLLRMPGFTSARLAAELPRGAGVELLPEGFQEIPDFQSLDRASASRWRCVLTRRGLDWLLLAEDPWDQQLQQKVAERIGQQPIPVAVQRAVLAGWLGEQQTAEQAGGRHDSIAAGPIVAFVDQVLQAAFTGGASDVHFECDRGGVTAKHRVDGVMHFFARLEGAERAQETISRIKVMSKLDITERRLPQDGRTRFDAGAQHLDLRVSIMPSVHGEDAVLRLLDKARLRVRDGAVSLASLGFGAAASASIRRLAALPSGMVLVTGPTGSGKTTTLYAVLSEINTGAEKIVTIEDPVEYELPGVLQIPVNDRKGLTFARGLRSILRHDPDRILVGEIRDAETAEIAVQSALTGHLVFTTVHANGIADVVGRFRHFGLDMFGFMSSLNGVVVQRLVRRLCRHCVDTRPATPEEADWLARAGCRPQTALPKAVGCMQCQGSGYTGRFVIAEVHESDDTFRDLVNAGAPLVQLKADAQRRGLVPLWQEAARHVTAGVTSAEEVQRVVGWS